MTTYRKGAENIPLREINKNLPILVMVYDLATDKLIEEKRMDYGNAEDRKHLGRITFWALTNHCSVETIAMIDADKEYEKDGK